MIYFPVSLQQQLMGRDSSDGKWESVHLTHRPAVTAPQHWDTLNTITVGMLDAELCKGHKYAGRFGGLFGFLFQVAEGFSFYRSNRTMMFPSAVEFAAHFCWMDTWFQGPSAAFSKADARNISPAEKWVGVWTQPAGRTWARYNCWLQWHLWLVCKSTVLSFPRELRTLNPSGEGGYSHGLWTLSKPSWHCAAGQTFCFCPSPKEDFKEEIPGWAILFRAELVL